MKITVLSADTLDQLVAAAPKIRASFASVHMNCALSEAPARLNGIADTVLGATSCQGAMTHDGVTPGVAAFLIDDPEGSYGSAAMPFDDNIEDAASKAVVRALQAADRLGERPDLVWVSATPGGEEAVIAGITAVVGPDVPIIGGSAADNTVEGNWFVFDSTSHTPSGVVVSVMFPSTPISFAYHNGYAPTPHSGVVTKVTGRRIFEIDNRPAMEVYNDWTNGAMTGPTGSAEALPILSDSTFHPFGRADAVVNGVPHYLLAHPATAHSDGSMDMFANVAQGETLTLMTGTQDGLADRAGRVAALSRQLRTEGQTPMAGALMIYCGGCMLGVQDKLDRVVSGVNTALDGTPFLGAFTFGEQGPLVGSGNRHGNLMISCIVFSGE